MAKANVHVTGDAYNAMFFIPKGRISLNGKRSDHAYAFAIPVGTEYIYRSIKSVVRPPQLCNEESPEDKICVTRCPFPLPSNHSLGSGKEPNGGQEIKALYEVIHLDDIPSKDGSTENVPLLRLASGEMQQVLFPNFTQAACGSDTMPEEIAVVVNWFGEPGIQREPIEPISCDVHVQTGLLNGLSVESSSKGCGCAKPKKARIVVLNIGELSEVHRIRKSLSYEAIAVDLLCFLRGSGVEAVPKVNILRQLLPASVEEDVEPVNILVVRLNKSAVFLYACKWIKEGFQEIGAWLLCHEDECAPLSQPELGQMLGYTGFISAHIAAAMASEMQSVIDCWKNPDKVVDVVRQGVRRGIHWQHVAFERGYFHMLFQDGADKKGGWRPASTNVDDETSSEKLGYSNAFCDIVGILDERYKKFPDSSAYITRHDKEFEKKIHTIAIEIKDAVAHRKQWFMARAVAEEFWRGGSEPATFTDDQLKDTFKRIAMKGICRNDEELPSVPVVKIGDAELIDRREIEDYLAIHQVLNVYANSNETKPLNIAVFGAPGAGKSFAVEQIVKHIGRTKGRGHRRCFQKEPLVFNLSQFGGPEDLPAALHLVRNECLSGEIPIVFFDEFDSDVNGHPFGWLKYFLAPMQDARFYHDGQNYKMGRAVFVFAGGVNRSFEELNGRVRNPSFCEAKGPDFISRLKAHLNVQGINKPEDDEDQYRYILRRGVLLKGILKKRLEPPRPGKDYDNDRELLHPSVARALLQIERFKHGVRSLDAIISMCSTRPGCPIGPSDLPSMAQLDMHVDAEKLLRLIDADDRNAFNAPKKVVGDESPGIEALVSLDSKRASEDCRGGRSAGQES